MSLRTTLMPNVSPMQTICCVTRSTSSDHRVAVSRRVGKIACTIISAWARRTRNFAHADRLCIAPFAHPTFSSQSIAQAGLLDERERHIAEFAHALLVAWESEQHAVEAGPRQREQRIDDLLLRAHHGKPAPSLNEGLLQRLEAFRRVVALID